jgi:hypothetical protein
MVSSILIHPASLSVPVPDESHLLEELRNAEFISDEYQSGYLCGAEYLNYMTYLGCSPHIIFHPDDNGPLTLIKTHTSSLRPVCMGHTRNIKPKCPSCKKMISDWKIKNWEQPDTQIICPDCESHHSMSDLKWRNECVYTSFAIEITQVHPHEAVPSEKLMNLLEALTNFNWDFGYIEYS